MDFIHINIGDIFNLEGFIQRITSDPELMEKLSNACMMLICLSAADPHGPEDEERNPWFDREHVRYIGEYLYSLGQEAAMQLAIHMCRDLFYGRYDARALEFAWDGIGQFRC